jgi:2-C-methyl-D-erythritol 2,4-cyclodiphosphate synthase
MNLKNIDSKILLKRSFDLIASKGYKIVNVDASLSLEAPKIKKYVPDMQNIISEILKVQIEDVSIKATTSEKMGFVGREEGLMAQAVVLLQKI